MAELLQPEQVVDVHSGGLADTVDVIPCKVDKHDVLCPVLF